MLIRHAALAAGLLLMSGGAALAQNYPPEPPGGYQAAPPPEWAHRDFWAHMDEHHRQAFWAEHRRESWRCDHGDREACHWLRDHG